MSGPPPFARKPYETTGYASLKPAATADRNEGSGEPAKAAGPSEFDLEAARLKALREALWCAFEAGPDAGLPTTLIDLSMAYTGSLKLQLSMRGYAHRHTATKPRPSPRPTPSAKGS